MCLVLSDLFRAQLVRRTLVEARELFHDPQVALRGKLGQVATLEFLQHHFSEMGHRDLLCDPHYRHHHFAAGLCLREASAASGGFVQRHLWMTMPFTVPNVRITRDSEIASVVRAAISRR
jgi:hypothetical protein